MDSKYIKSPMNYVGNKYRIIDQIQKWFPENIDTMVDLFCGGLDVTINTRANVHYANDINYHVIDIYRAFQKYPADYVLRYIEDAIDRYQLSKTNAEGYLSLRKHYNDTKNPLDLFVLLCYSFNNNLRFNNKQEYNASFGRNRSSFNDVMRENLINLLHRIPGIKFTSLGFQDFDFSVLGPGDFLYADPPYLTSCGVYNDGKRGFTGWGNKEETDLYAILNDLNQNGVMFALSNVIEHKGKRNEILEKWCGDNGYSMHDISMNYDNCIHCPKNTGTTKEVLITNY